MTPSTGALPSILQVTVEPTNLTVGTYQGTITISVPNASPSASKVAVTFTISPFVAPALGVSCRM